MNETTPVRLIRAARRIFADKGYHGASVREIAASASANLGAITYHFGSKQGLYDAVLDSVLEPLSSYLVERAASAETSDEGAAGPGSPLGRIDEIVGALFELLAANPDLQLLVMQQVVTRRSLPAPLRNRLGPLLDRLTEEVVAGQADGTIGGSDPHLTAISLVAQPMYFGLVTRFAPDRLRQYGSSASRTATISRHARRFIRAGLAAGREDENG